MRGFNWDDIQAFLAIARAGRLTAAAQQFGVDHSTLSRRVAALETALGTRLFDRRTVGFVLTPEGEQLLEDAETMESLAIKMRTRLDDQSIGLTGTVRIGTPEGFGTYFLAPRLARLTTTHPNLDIELVANPRLFSLSKREADIAITMARPAQGRVYAQKLVDYALGVYGSRSYLAATPPIRTRKDALERPWIGYIEDLMWTSELNYLAQVAASLSPRVRISNVITQATALRGGMGLGVLPCFIAQTEPDLVRVLPDEIALSRTYWMVTHADTRDVARVKLMTDFLRAQVADTADGLAFWQMGF
jgi:DNA-binding transcriptional LysR family regulator